MHIPENISESVLKNVIETAPFPIGLYTGYELKIVLANRTMVETYGKGPDVIGKNYTDILPELENQAIFDQMRSVLATGIPFEARNQRVDIEIGGKLQLHYFNYNFTPIYGSDGKIYGVMNTAAELTDLNIAKNAATAAEERLSLAVDAASLGTFEIKSGGTEVQGSQRFFEIMGEGSGSSGTGHIVGRLLGENAWDRFASVSDTNENLDRIIESEADGEPKFIKVTGFAATAWDTGSRSIIGIVQDITEQVATAMELQKIVQARTEELHRSNLDLQQFAHVLSHDLKEPVRKIRMFIGLLESSLQVAPAGKAAGYLAKIQSSADRMVTMIDGILEYSAFAADSKSFSAEADLAKIMSGICEDFEIAINSSGAEIQVGSLPRVSGSEILMHQLFYNLVGNALKFSSSERPPLIRIWGETDGTTAVVHVADNGIGIDPKYQQYIFGALKRLHSKEEYEGTGLGLALCQKIVSRHGGGISVSSTPGSGSEFTISLPAAL